MGLEDPARFYPSYCGRVPELDEAGRSAMREKAQRNGGPDKDVYGHMSDEWVADRVRMLMRGDIDHEAICQAARDRIMRLVLRQLALEAALTYYIGNGGRTFGSPYGQDGLKGAIAHHQMYVEYFQRALDGKQP